MFQTKKTPCQYVMYRALARQVMAVAVFEVDIGDWVAYIDAVPGVCHDHEWAAVKRVGDKLPREVAEVMFAGELYGANRVRVEKMGKEDNLIWRG